MLRDALRVTATTALVLVLSGCGGTSEEDRVREAVHDYFAAVATKDGDRACELVVDEQVREWDDGGGVPCRDFVLVLATPPDGADPAMAKRLAATQFDVSVNGDRAEASETRAGCFELVRERGAWKMTTLGC